MKKYFTEDFMFFFCLYGICLGTTIFYFFGSVLVTNPDFLGFFFSCVFVFEYVFGFFMLKDVILEEDDED